MREKDTVKNEEAPKREEHARHAANRRWDLPVALVCIVLSFLVWLCVMNVRDTEHVSLEVKDALAGYTYELSASSVEVEGNIATLKSVNAIEIEVPVHSAGTYTVPEENILLPEGVSLASNTRITVTVREK